MNTPDEIRLKQYFANSRASDERSAPDFVNTVAAASTRAVARERRRRTNGILAAGMLLGMAGLGVVLIHKPPYVAPKEAVSLLSWTSPTDFLLETPGKQFATGMPAPGSSGIYGLPRTGKESK